MVLYYIRTEDKGPEIDMSKESPTRKLSSATIVHRTLGLALGLALFIRAHVRACIGACVGSVSFI